MKGCSAYAVQASIHGGGRLMFTTTRRYPVLTQEHPSTLEIILEKVG